ncbi:type IV pilus modification protein PilV [Variovorax sp. YR216]|uniref:type IV pilus modification protein PilV n=1 Tax=Variovorax sp. YR216 TaxID=1882828 RepID=UPI00089D5FFF|nr:type IV pilus modification protein PilV [Variovorax sp. YR216]SEA21208.1 type IV pilus assembly protein PilV [Variovorax sp. YR216]
MNAKTTRQRLRRRGAQRGVALIEILVSLVILLFGLLGLAGISSRANLAELESYQRIQAVQLVQDMAERLNANRKVASCYSNGTAGIQLSSTSSTIPTCAAGNVQQQTQAAADLAAWRNMIQGQSEIDKDAKGNNLQIGAMIGAVGCITLDDATNNVYLIAVSWQGLASTAAPLSNGAAFPCGSGVYGNEKLHRVVTTKVRIGTLS